MRNMHKDNKNVNAPKKSKHIFAIWMVPLGLISFGLFLYVVISLTGADVSVFNPKGKIAREQFNLIKFIVSTMLVIAIPAVSTLYYTAWKYRENNTRKSNTYSPNLRHGRFFVAKLWALPIVFLIIIGTTLWPATHRLAPAKQIESDKETITIHAIAMQWKWVFIYPDQDIATVNFVQLPIDTPVEFVLTADDAPMSSFWIPNLGGQLYAMTGHTNILNLMAEETGDYKGVSPEINGAGFAGMKFTTRVSSEKDFNQWVDNVRLGDKSLDENTYDNLLLPSEYNNMEFFASNEINMNDKILSKYSDPAKNHTENNKEESHHH